MQNNIINPKTIALSLLTLGLTVSSCDDYLSDIPKGNKMPQTYKDFEAFLRDEHSIHTIDPGQTIILMNDRYPTMSNLNYYEYWAANYNWDEAADRIALNKGDETPYYAGYAGISTCNLILEYGPDLTECTEAQRQELMAQARVLRAMNYFYLVNYYADTYESGTASSKGGVPLITSAAVGASYSQPSVQEIYDFILKDMTEAYPSLPQKAATELHPNQATADAFMARVYLQMNNYSDALSHAEKALAYNDSLYNWCEFYEMHADAINDPTNYTSLPAPNAFNYKENYSYRHGASSYNATIYHLPMERAAEFEEGDTRYLAQWKAYTTGAETYMRGMTRGMHNWGGMTTVEAFLIKAECLARTNRIGEAMETLNKVRETRILPELYQPLTANTEAEAIPLIMRTKRNELIMTTVPFCDARRLNAEGKYLITPSKEINGQKVQLSANSHLWTFPFPLGAKENKGNGNIQQNVSK